MAEEAEVAEVLDWGWVGAGSPVLGESTWTSSGIAVQEDLAEPLPALDECLLCGYEL